MGLPLKNIQKLQLVQNTIAWAVKECKLLGSRDTIALQAVLASGVLAVVIQGTNCHF